MASWRAQDRSDPGDTLDNIPHMKSSPLPKWLTHFLGREWQKGDRNVVTTAPEEVVVLERDSEWQGGAYKGQKVVKYMIVF